MRGVLTLLTPFNIEKRFFFTSLVQHMSKTPKYFEPKECEPLLLANVLKGKL